MRKKLIVMQLQSDPSIEGVILNPYVKLLTDALPSNRIRTRWFRWRGILTDRFDVLHVHWPEFYIRHERAMGRLIKTVLFSVFLTRLWIQRKPVVRTVHNLKPHESGSRFEALLLSWLDAMTTRWVVMNESTPTPDAKATVLIPHGHYREWYQIPSDAKPQPGSLLTFGRIRAYKGIDELLEAFSHLDTSVNVSLKVMGKPDGVETVESLRNFADDDSRISLDMRFIPDDELALSIAMCQVVVLPYRDILNSGSALLALSLNRPVVMRETPSTLLLQNEFGPEWVHLFKGSLTSDVLVYALEKASERDLADSVDMSRREWDVIGRQLANAYESASRAV